MNAAIAQHLNVAESAIIEIQEWARVLWVRVRGIGARFVSKKVVKVESIIHRGIEFKPVNKAIVEVNGKREMLTEFTLKKYDIPAKEADLLFFDLCRMVGRTINGAKQTEKKSPVKSQINPQWVMFNNLHNEGAEGFNPYPKYL